MNDTIRHFGPSKATFSGGLVRSNTGKRTASIEIDLYKAMGLAFTEKNVNWQPQMGYNAAFLRAQIEHAQMLLQVQGYVFLNDILVEMGFDREPAGQVLGWHREDGPLNVTFKERNDQLWLEITVHGVIVNRI